MAVDEEAAEAVTALFEQYGEGGVVIEEIPQPEAGPGAVRRVAKAFLPTGDAGRLEGLQRALWHLGQIHTFAEPQLRDLGPTDWAEAWKSGYQVLRLGRQLRIVPSWISYTPEPEDVVINLDPGMAFGTGVHPSTQLCLQALEELVRPGARVLDVGTGSGILAIAAAKLGAAEVLAIDIDRLAVQTARENIARNAVGNVVQVLHGSIDGPPRGSFNGVLANILAETIASLAPELARHVASSGWLVASGIVEPRLGLVEQAFGATGLAIVRRWQSDDWVAVEARSQAAGQ